MVAKSPFPSLSAHLWKIFFFLVQKSLRESRRKTAHWASSQDPQKISAKCTRMRLRVGFAPEFSKSSTLYRSLDAAWM
jgi:hypothetical protein